MNSIFTGPQVGAEVQRLFTDPPPRARRVVITAYVGSDPVPLLGDVNGMEVYCSPSPTGTSADGVWALIAKGAKVYFSKALHMKVYSVEGRGALIGSANLSDNGLRGGLTEVLVAVPAAPIDDLISSFKHRAKPAKQADILKLQRGNYAAVRRGRGVGESAADGQKGRRVPTDYPTWYARGAPRGIKLGWYTDESKKTHKKVRDAAKFAGFDDGVEDFNGSESEAAYVKGDLVLVLRVGDGLLEPLEHEPDWLYVDGVTELTKQEAKDAGMDTFRFIAWQGAAHRLPPPFSVTGSRIQRALQAGWRDFAPGWKKNGSISEKMLASPPEEFFASVMKHYEAEKK